MGGVPETPCTCLKNLLRQEGAVAVVHDFVLAFGVTGNRRNNGRGGLEGTSPNEVTAELRSFGATTRQVVPRAFLCSK